MECIVKSGETAVVKPDGLLLNDGTTVPDWSEKCTIENGANIEMSLAQEEENETIVQKNKKTIKKETVEMPPENKENAESTVAAPETSTIVADEAPKQVLPTETEATTSVPSAPFDVNQLVQSTGGGAGVAIALAAVAVVGGGAAWKFYQKFAEQKHEQKMKELDIKAQQQGLNGAQPPPCQAQNAILEARMAAIEGKLATIEKKSASFSADFDADELEGRVVKLEKKIKTLSAKST